MKTGLNTLLGAALSLLVTTKEAHSAAAEAKGISLPATAQEIGPGVYYLGRVTDRGGREIDGIAFVHSRNLEARTTAGGRRAPKPDPYGFAVTITFPFGPAWTTSSN